MATLSVTNSFVAGTLAEASEVNTNFQDIITWSQGNIQEDNLGTFSGLLSWNISTGVGAIAVSNSGDQGSIVLTQSAALNPNRAGLKLEHTAAEVSGDAAAFVDLSNASSSIPGILSRHAGSGDAVQAKQSGSGNAFFAEHTGSGKYFVGNDGANDEIEIDGDELKYSPGGTEALKVDSSELVFSASGSQELKSDSTGLQIGDSNGPLLSQEGSGPILKTSSDIAIGGGGITFGAGPQAMSDGAFPSNVRFTADGLQLNGAGGPKLFAIGTKSFGVIDGDAGPTVGSVLLSSNPAGNFRVLEQRLGSVSSGQVINFPAAFAGVPVVTVTAEGPAAPSIVYWVGGVNANNFTIYHNQAFIVLNYIAIGPY